MQVQNVDTSELIAPLRSQFRMESTEIPTMVLRSEEPCVAFFTYALLFHETVLQTRITPSSLTDCSLSSVVAHAPI